ncbi:Abi-alpha family protein [uncultured Algibacter sp.]|uniref:Abi-alpha family protein n=1 Tax=uncultured Algibacter sp. TaxID=298659 RepID=UPI0026354CA2|nr:Abi-alpha family protein [uncultured Algibacter sp.]
MSENKNIDIANGIGIAAEKALDFIEKIIAAPIMEGTGIFTDKVKYWRFKNQVNIITKAREYLKSKGIETPKKLPIKDVTTLLEYASFEEDEIMQDSWAKLLANAMNPKNQFNTCHLFSQVLNQISVNELYLLSYAKSRSYIMTSDDRPYLDRGDLIRNSHSDFHTGPLLIDNLLRLRLIEEEPPKFKEALTSETYLYREDKELPKNEIIASDSFRLSKFGAELMRQVTE